MVSPTTLAAVPFAVLSFSRIRVSLGMDLKVALGPNQAVPCDSDMGQGTVWLVSTKTMAWSACGSLKTGSPLGTFNQTLHSDRTFQHSQERGVAAERSRGQCSLAMGIRDSLCSIEGLLELAGRTHCCTECPASASPSATREDQTRKTTARSPIWRRI